MCWSIRVYWTVLHNLLARFFSDIASKCSTYTSSQLCCCYCCCCCCGCCQDGGVSNCQKHQQMGNSADDGAYYDPPENDWEISTSSARHQEQHHDYVIMDDIDANYIQIEKRKIETEPFYRTVDRATAEDILDGREDGTCLVRPYKEEDITIKYIVSIYAQNEFFHLFIRQVPGRDMYAIGQEKSQERLYNTPNDIIDFYRHNTLLCTNKDCTLSLVLRPIIV